MPRAISNQGPPSPCPRPWPRTGYRLGSNYGRGKPIEDFRSAWDIATRKAGCPDKLVHDFRRTAVRNLERAGVSRSVCRPPDDSVYLRYCIASEKDLQKGQGNLSNFTEKKPPIHQKGKEVRLRCVLAPLGPSLVILMVILAIFAPLAGTPLKA